MKSIILEFIVPILIIIFIVFLGIQTQEKNKYKESIYIVSVENRYNSVDITFIEPSVKNVTQLMLLNYIDSLNVKDKELYKNKELYFMVIPKEVNKAIRDSSINVLRNSEAYMRKVKFYSLKPNTIK